MSAGFEVLELDGGRPTKWLFARCVLESLDDPALRRVAARLVPA